MKTRLRNFFFIKINFIFALIFLFVYFLIATQPGLVLVLKLGSLYTQSNVEFSKIEGRLWDKIVIKDFHYQSDELTVSAKKIQLDWTASELLYKKIFIREIKGNSIKIFILKDHENKPKKEENNFSMPVDLVVKNALLNDISVAYSDTVSFDVKKLTANLEVDEKIWIHLNMDIPSTEISNINFDAKGTLIAFDWTLDVFGDQTDWNMLGTGNKNSLTFKTEKTYLLNTQSYLSGYLYWDPDFLWDITVKSNSLTLPVIAEYAQDISLNIQTKGSLENFVLNASEIKANVLDKTLAGSIKIKGTSSVSIPKSSLSKDFNFYTFLNNLTFDIQSDLKYENMMLGINGNVTDKWNLKYQFDSGELNQMSDKLKGRLQATGAVTGIKSHPILNTTLLIKSLMLDTLSHTMMNGELYLLTAGNIAPDKEQGFIINADIRNFVITHLLNDKKLIIPINGLFKTIIDSKGFRSEFSLFFYKLKDNFIKANLNMPTYTQWRKLNPNDVMNGELKIALNQLNILQLLVPQMFNPKGNIKGDLKVKNLLNDAEFSGNMKIENLNFYVRNLGIRPVLNLVAIPNGNTLNYKGEIMSGDGKINLEGKSVFSDNISTRVSIKGQNFLLSNLPKTKLKISPDLQLTSETDESWDLKGKVFVPEANLDFGDTRATVVLPAQIIIISPQGEIQKNEPLQMGVYIETILGDDVKLQVSGLNGKLAGKFFLLQDPEKGILGNGQIFLNGTYDLVGEILSIKDGIISYNLTPLESPGLNVRAQKQISYNSSQVFNNTQTLTVGIWMQGTVDDPRITLFSDPAGWSQSDILSLIILGQPASSVSPTDIPLLLKAAQTLSPHKGSNITSVTKQLQQKLGLSDLRIETELNNTDGYSTAAPETSTSVVLGKYLSPKLYLSYSVGVFNALSTLRLKYLLGKHWFVQTQSNVQGNGADLFYSIEK